MDRQQDTKVRNRIKAVLAEQGEKSRWLAKELGKSENTVSRWCSNKTQPSLEQLGEIASILNVDVKTLIMSTEK
jgi:transcriptional regulator with XRE-family HTH domain